MVVVESELEHTARVLVGYVERLIGDLDYGLSLFLVGHFSVALSDL